MTQAITSKPFVYLALSTDNGDRLVKLYKKYTMAGESYVVRNISDTNNSENTDNSVKDTEFTDFQAAFDFFYACVQEQLTQVVKHIKEETSGARTDTPTV